LLFNWIFIRHICFIWHTHLTTPFLWQIHCIFLISNKMKNTPICQYVQTFSPFCESQLNLNKILRFMMTIYC
jgi:hypothetical protein